MLGLFFYSKSVFGSPLIEVSARVPLSSPIGMEYSSIYRLGTEEFPSGES